VKRAAVVGVVVLVVLVALGGCQPARLGARCATSDFGDGGGAWVLRCENGRWARFITKAQTARAILALHATTTTAPHPVTVPTTAPRPPEPAVGSTRSNPVPLGTRARIGGQFWLWVNGGEPIISTPSDPNGTVAPPAGDDFVVVAGALQCGTGTELPCSNGADRSGVHLWVVDGTGVEYPVTSAADVHPDLLTDLHSSGAILTGSVVFQVPEGAVGDLVLKVRVDGSALAPTYLAVR
jgi:hypothetical protein